jgi:hypothetical protein
LKIELKQKW